MDNFLRHKASMLVGMPLLPYHGWSGSLSKIYFPSWDFLYLCHPLKIKVIKIRLITNTWELHTILELNKMNSVGFPAGTVVKNPPANAGDTGSSPDREDSTGHRATKPASHNCWAREPQLLKPACPRARAPQQEKPPQWEAHEPPQWRVAPPPKKRVAPTCRS